MTKNLAQRSFEAMERLREAARELLEATKSESESK